MKLISIPQIDFSNRWRQGWNKINLLSKFDKYMILFWLLGPFIYLIERDPADLWLTLICLFFLARCIKRKDWRWASQFWFKSALALWLFSLLSAVTSPDPFFSFQQGFVWIRFPLYAVAAQVWLAKDRDIRIIMLLSILLGLLIMCGILIAETIMEPKIRLTWPYGDLVPGGYISKFSFPLLCVLITIAVSKKNKAGIYSAVIALLSISVCALTGERTNFLIIACGGILASIIWRPKFIIVSILISIQILIILVLFFNHPADLSNRFGKQFLNNIQLVNTSNQNPYWGAWRGGLQQGLINPVKGIGPSGTRNTCETLDTSLPKWLPGKNYCGIHPHNFYIQLFAEIGIVGLIFGCLMFASITISCYQARKYNFNCPMAATAFIVPFGLFFPFQQFGSFYGQWGNLFIWFAIGFALSQYDGWSKHNKNDQI